MRKDGIIIPVSLDLQEADVDEELISRNDVKLNNEYAESLFLMGTALNSISGATQEGASAWLSYSASVVGGIASMLPALASVFGFTAALGIAEQSKIPFPMNIIAMTATGVGLAATIASLPKFASGGIFAGNSSIGDMNLARVNSGEMILNHSQQGRLFNILDGRGTLDNAASGGQVEFKIKGRNLEGALKKNTKINNRIR